MLERAALQTIADKYLGIHLLQGVEAKHTDYLHLRPVQIQWLLGHDLGLTLLSVARAKKRVSLRAVQSWHASIPMAAWHAAHHAERLAAADYARELGKELYEVGPNEPLPGTDWQAYARWEKRRARYLRDTYGITAIVGNWSVGTTHQAMLDAFVRGWSAEPGHLDFVLGVHEFAALDYRMWLLPGWQGEAINSADLTQDWPALDTLMWDDLKDEVWLWGRILRYVAPLAALPGFKGILHSETALDKITSEKWRLDHEDAAGIHDFAPIWQARGIADPPAHYAQQVLMAIAVFAHFCQQLDIPYLGANLWSLGHNWGKFPVHNIAGRWLLELMKYVSPPAPSQIPVGLPAVPAMPDMARTIALLEMLKDKREVFPGMDVPWSADDAEWLALDEEIKWLRSLN